MEGINFGILWYFFAVKGMIYLASAHGCQAGYDLLCSPSNGIWWCTIYIV